MAEVDSKKEPMAGQLVRVLDANWSEYSAPNGRKFYKNQQTSEITWKPPRKSKLRNSKEQPKEKQNETRAKGSSLKSSSWSLPANPEDSVGGILRKGELKIFRLDVGKASLKKKWLKCIAYLTNTHFVFIRKKKLDENCGKISLNGALIREDCKRKKVYCLGTTKETVIFKSKNPLECEAWFHAIAAIIHNLNRPKDQRPKSFIEWSSGVFSANDLGSFAYGFESTQNSSDSIGQTQSLSRKIISGNVFDILSFKDNYYSHRSLSAIDSQILSEMHRRDNSRDSGNVESGKQTADFIFDKTFGQSCESVEQRSRRSRKHLVVDKEISETPVKKRIGSKENLLTMPSIDELEEKVQEMRDLNDWKVGEPSDALQFRKHPTGAEGSPVARKQINAVEDMKVGQSLEKVDDNDPVRLRLSSMGESSRFHFQGKSVNDEKTDLENLRGDKIEETENNRPHDNETRLRNVDEIFSKVSATPGEDVVVSGNKSQSIENAAEMKERQRRNSPSDVPDIDASFHRDVIAMFPPNFKYPTPPGWVVRFDAHRREYLYENVKNEVWAVAKCQASGDVYFYDTMTMRRCWVLPSVNGVRPHWFLGMETRI